MSIVNTGVAITRIIEPHPVNINTFASEIVLPSFERMDEVAVLKVADMASGAAALNLEGQSVGSQPAKAARPSK